MTLDRSLRIVMFAPHFSEYAARLAGALSARAHVLLLTEAANYKAECEGLAIPVQAPGLAHVSYRSDYALRRVSLRGRMEMRHIRRAIEAFAPDIIHVQEQGDQVTAAIATDFSQVCPIVLTVHDPAPHSGNDAMVAQRFAAGLFQLRAIAGAYHVHGAYCEARLRGALETSKPIAATAHGVILGPEGDHSAEGGNHYLFFGRMEAYKGLDVLLDAIDLLPVDGDARFVLAGRGPELERFRPRIGANPAIELIDRFLPPLEAVGQFQRARAVVVPYRDATQSGVISAAVGNGRPVIATRVGGLIDAVEHGTNGLLVPSEDPVALAAAIDALADESIRRRLTDGAKAAAAGKFAWSAIAERLHALYADLLGVRRRQAARGDVVHPDRL